MMAERRGAYRCSKAHRRQCLGEEEDGEVGAGDADGDDRDHIVQEGVDRFPVGREIPRKQKWMPAKMQSMT